MNEFWPGPLSLVLPLRNDHDVSELTTAGLPTLAVRVPAHPMAQELLAAGMTRSVNSLDVKGLKVPDGPPHGLGQFYILIDPDIHGDHFADRFARVAEAVAEQEGARIPGASRTEMLEVDVPDALWKLVQKLAN